MLNIRARTRASSRQTICLRRAFIAIRLHSGVATGVRSSCSPMSRCRYRRTNFLAATRLSAIAFLASRAQYVSLSRYVVSSGLLCLRNPGLSLRGSLYPASRDELSCTKVVTCPPEMNSRVRRLSRIPRDARGPSPWIISNFGQSIKHFAKFLALSDIISLSVK